MLSTHYRNPLNFTNEVVANVKKEVAKVQNVLSQASLYLQTHNGHLDQPYDVCTLNAVAEILEDDLNTSNALTSILDQVKLLNSALRSKEKQLALVENNYATLVKMTELLGFKFDVKVLNEQDIALYQTWENYKQEKNFQKADELRQTLIERGIL